MFWSHLFVEELSFSYTRVSFWRTHQEVAVLNTRYSVRLYGIYLVWGKCLITCTLTVLNIRSIPGIWTMDKDLSFSFGLSEILIKFRALAKLLCHHLELLLLSMMLPTCTESSCWRNCCWRHVSKISFRF